MTNTSLLEEMIAKSGMKKKFLAEAIGITTAALTMKIRNIREFKASEIEILCNHLGVSSLEDRQRIFLQSR